MIGNLDARRIYNGIEFSIFHSDFPRVLLATHRKRWEFRNNDGINSLSLGVMSQISGVVLRFLSLGAFA